MKRLASIGLILFLAGCGGEPERSRVVPATDAARTAIPADEAKALRKDPRNIPTH